MAGKIVEKDPTTKMAKQRLSVLEMAETLGNISEACRRGGMDRTSFYEWKRRFQTHGLEGLKDMPPIPKSQPNQTTPETEAAILECSLAHPSWGCVKLSDFLKLQGISVSSPTVQKILIRNDMAMRTVRIGGCGSLRHMLSCRPLVWCLEGEVIKVDFDFNDFMGWLRWIAILFISGRKVKSDTLWAIVQNISALPMYCNSAGYVYVASAQSTATEIKYDYIDNSNNTTINDSQIIDVTDGILNIINENGEKKTIIIDSLNFDFSDKSYTVNAYDIVYDNDIYTYNYYTYNVSYTYNYTYITQA